MAYCQECNKHWPGIEDVCPVCKQVMNDSNDDAAEWKMLGTLDDKMTAGLAKEVLESSGIPAVVISRSGFFGSMGLTLDSFYSGKPGTFELSVPTVRMQEADEILCMTLGEDWNRSRR